MQEPADINYETNEPFRVKRIAYRASYDVEIVHSILDSGYICHIAFVDEARPQVIPMTYWRDGEYVYFHGAARGRFARACQTGDVALSVTIMDGLVLGHSPINHSANYRSVVVHGRPEIIESRVEKEVSMRSFFAKTIPGRWEALRAVRDEELDAMSVFRLRLEQVAAKIRNEFPDDEDHMPSVPVWTGILPSHQTFGSPVADERFPALPLPEYLDAFVGKAPFASRVDKC